MDNIITETRYNVLELLNEALSEGLFILPEDEVKPIIAALKLIEHRLGDVDDYFTG